MTDQVKLKKAEPAVAGNYKSFPYKAMLLEMKEKGIDELPLFEQAIFKKKITIKSKDPKYSDSDAYIFEKDGMELTVYDCAHFRTLMETVWQVEAGDYVTAVYQGKHPYKGGAPSHQFKVEKFVVA